MTSITQPNLVYVKTPAGRDELKARSAGLSTKQRSILIMLDGLKPLTSFQNWLPIEDIQEAVLVLLELGFAVKAPPAPAKLASKPAAAPVKVAAKPAPPAKAAAPARALAEPVKVAIAAAPPSEELLKAKLFMRRSAEKYLGLLAADIVRRIDQANDEPQLQAVLGLWHMALRDSKYGKDVASDLLEQTKDMLLGEPQL